MAILNGSKYTVPFGSLRFIQKKGLHNVYRYTHTDGKTYYFVIYRNKVLYKAFTCKECLSFIDSLPKKENKTTARIDGKGE